MCIIITKDRDVKPLDRAYFERAWDSNSDGGGVVWREPDGTVKIKKGIMEKDQFLKLLDKVNKKDYAFIAHFRIRSVGEVKPENCHPFVLDHLTFAHNGTLTHLQAEQGKTDSETFGLACLKDKDMNFLKENQLLVELAIGSSKMAFMDNETGEILILNKEYGVERDGCWMSNTSADKPVYTPISYNNGVFAGRSYYGGISSGFSPYNVKGQAFFGTKTPDQFSEWSKEQKCMVYKASNSPCILYGFSNPVYKNRRGLAIIPMDAHIPDGKNIVYKKGNKVFSKLCKMQKDLDELLKTYHHFTFATTYDRTYAECEIHATNIVLNALRRLVMAGKEITEDIAKKFITDYLEPKSWTGSSAQDISEFVKLTLLDFFAE